MPAEDIRWRAIAQRDAAEGDGFWTGRWHPTRDRALKQALKWAALDETADTWLETSDGRRVEVPS